MKKALQDRVEIIMATYNGQDFIEEQIDSIINQTHKNIHLFIRDDGSKDDTLKIINKKIAEYPDKITLINSNDRLGVIGNFSALLKEVSGDYIMFSDQDDVWLPQKIDATLKKMKTAEAMLKDNLPILVHTDLKVVDRNLDILNPSFWNYTRLAPKKGQFLHQLLMQGVVTGCTMMINKPLADLVYPIPNEVIMHDWWIALVAAAFGKIDHVNAPTMLYRQHGKNQVGAKKESFLRAIVQAVKQPSEHAKKAESILNRQQKQAHAFHSRFLNDLDIKQSQALKDFCQIKLDTPVKSISLVCKHGFYKHGLSRNIRLFLALGFLKYFKKK